MGEIFISIRLRGSVGDQLAIKERLRFHRYSSDIHLMSDLIIPAGQMRIKFFIGKCHVFLQNERLLWIRQLRTVDTGY